MEELINENLIKTEKIVIKNQQGESVRTEEIESPAQNISTYSLTNSSDNQTQEEIPLASGETAVYVEQYSNIQDLRKAIEQNYPEKDDEEVAKDILLAINQEDLAENMTTAELMNTLEFKTTCGMGAIPLSSNNTVSLASVNNEYGSLDDNNEDVNTYIFAAYYGLNGAGNAEFYSYSAARWKTRLSSSYSDIMVIAFDGGKPYYRIESSHLAIGIKGSLINTIECRNIKYPKGQVANQYNMIPYNNKINTWTYETTKVAENDIYSNNNGQVTIDRMNNAVVCTAPIKLGCENCSTVCDGYDMIHSPIVSQSKMISSGYFVADTNDKVSSFGGVYYHTKKQLKVTPSVGLNLSYNSKSGFGINGSLSTSFSSQYVKTPYFTPQINIQFNSKGEFYKFE